jgi:hypothetical protein
MVHQDRDDLLVMGPGERVIEVGPVAPAVRGSLALEEPGAERPLPGLIAESEASRTPLWTIRYQHQPLDDAAL